MENTASVSIIQNVKGKDPTQPCNVMPILAVGKRMPTVNISLNVGDTNVSSEDGL